MINRNDILCKALDECVAEMYKWAQPSVDIKQLIADGYKDDEKNPLYMKHYLSRDNFNYIQEAYMSAYGITDNWDDTFELVYKQLAEGGIEDDYKSATEDHPGYRDYKKVLPLKEVMSCPGDFNTIIDYIKKIQNFFKGHSRETLSFNMTICLGSSPNTNAEVVEEYWRANGRPDFKIKDFNIADVIYGGINDEYLDITEEEFISTLK